LLRTLVIEIDKLWREIYEVIYFNEKIKF